MIFNLNLIYSQINPFLPIVFCWIGIFLFFGGISFWLFKKGNRIKRNLKTNPEMKFFKNVEIHVVSKSKLSYNFSIPCKIDLAIGRDEIHFLPGKFNVFILTNLIPSSVNLKTHKIEIHPEFSKSLKLKFNSDALQAFFKKFYFLRVNFECSLGFQSLEERKEFLYLTKSANEKPQ